MNEPLLILGLPPGQCGPYMEAKQMLWYRAQHRADDHAIARIFNCSSSHVRRRRRLYGDIHATLCQMTVEQLIAIIEPTTKEPY